MNEDAIFRTVPTLVRLLIGAISAAFLFVFVFNSEAGAFRYRRHIRIIIFDVAALCALCIIIAWSLYVFEMPGYSVVFGD